jgi:hypothetical protein
MSATTLELTSWSFEPPFYDPDIAFTLIFNGSGDNGANDYQLDIQASTAVHEINVNTGPSGTPNPIASGASTNLSVAATDSFAHPLSYSWSSVCPELPSNGTFSNAVAQNPTWTAPQNLTGSQKACTIQVNISDGTLSTSRSFAENVSTVPPSTELTAAVLPASRSVRVGTPATAFATVINIGHNPAIGCVIGLKTNILAAFNYQTTHPATNQPIGTPNTPVNIAAGGFQTFLISITPTAPISPTDVAINFNCTNSESAAVIVGLNTLLLSASNTPTPDIVALAATPSNDGIANISGLTGPGVFAVATVNVGASGSITVSADTGAANLPIGLSVCQTNPSTGICLGAISSVVTAQINSAQTPTFAIFIHGSGQPIPFDPANNRIVVRFKDTGGVTRGATSVAVGTQ